MNYSIKIKIPANADNKSLYSSIEDAFHQKNYKVERKDDHLTFERIASKSGGKYQILFELFEGFSKGKITIDKVNPELLICQMYCFKQLVVSLIVGLLINLIFSLYTGDYLTLFLRLGLPVVLITFMIGLLSGNSQVEDILRKTIKEIG